MNKRQFRFIIRLCSILLCTFSLSFAALADEGGPGVNSDGTARTTGSSEGSRVIVAGGAQTTDSRETATIQSGQAPTETGTKGASLGMFTTTGYCNCSKCSGGHNLTYSGTVPQARHTISADLSIYPLGTKLMIDDVIYTVEDMGSSVKGNWIDIYYGSHEEAVEHGMKTQEVFAVAP